MKRLLEQGIEGMDRISEKEVVRCVWTSAEDEALKEMAAKYRGEYWNLVANCMVKITPPTLKPKTAKQCRERWHNQIKPDVDLGALSNEEECKVFSLHEKYGNQWSKIAARLSKRTDNAIKNYFLCRLRRLVRSIKNECLRAVPAKSEVELSQTLYLIDYLYKYYISPDRHENIHKSLNSQIKKRTNRGDKYINKMVANGGVTIDKLSSFSRSLLVTSSFSSSLKVEKYAYLLSLASSNSSSPEAPRVECNKTDTLGSLSRKNDSVINSCTIRA